LKEFVWVWKERVDPKKARVPNFDVLAVRVSSTDEKDRLIAADPRRFFTEPHYDSFPAILVRLKAVTVATLTSLIHGAWECQAPTDLKRRQR
jgi:hypothetical protein